MIMKRTSSTIVPILAGVGPLGGRHYAHCGDAWAVIGKTVPRSEETCLQRATYDMDFTHDQHDIGDDSGQARENLDPQARHTIC